MLKASDCHISKSELKYSIFAALLCQLATKRTGKRFLGRLLGMASRHEDGIIFSYSLRKFLIRERKVSLGAYSYGQLTDLLKFPINTVIGRYVSIGPGVKIFQANHPLSFMSMHPFFYRKELGIVDKEMIDRRRINIGHDVWIGANAIITPGCSTIGNGSVIGAGAVVTKNIPTYAIVSGNPAKIIRYRYSRDQIEKLEKLKWWKKNLTELRLKKDFITQPVTDDTISQVG